MAQQKETAHIAAGRMDLGSPTWARTRDLRINSPSLYQLSYQGTALNYSVLRHPGSIQAGPRSVGRRARRIAFGDMRRGKSQIVKHRPQGEDRRDPKRDRAKPDGVDAGNDRLIQQQSDDGGDLRDRLHL